MTTTIARSYSWGRLPLVEQQIIEMPWRDQSLPDTPYSLLPWGLGRSYGDCCVNDGNAVISLVHPGKTRASPRIRLLDVDSGKEQVSEGAAAAARSA